MKILLHSTTTVPANDGSDPPRGIVHYAGETIELEDALAERLIRLGVAEKAGRGSRSSED